MPYQLLTVLRNGLCLVACWFVLLAVLTERLPVPIPGLPLIMVAVAGCFLGCGPLTGALAMVLLGLSAEALSSFPAGRLVFAAMCAGLIMLHLLRMAQWSIIGRGFLMCSLGAFTWQLLIEFFQLPQTGINGSGVLLSAVWQAGLAGLYWLIAAVLVCGFRVVWKEAASRPVRFGTNF